MNILKINFKRIAFEPGELREMMPFGSINGVNHLVLAGDMTRDDIEWMKMFFKHDAKEVERLDLEGLDVDWDSDEWIDVDWDTEQNTPDSLIADMEWPEKMFSLTLPKWVEWVDVDHISHYLRSVYMPEGNDTLCEVDGALYDGEMKTLLCCPGRREKKLTVPEGVVSIAEGAFANVNLLEELELPASIEEMDDRELLFTARLRKISFPESMRDNKVFLQKCLPGCVEWEFKNL